ncbi:MAG: hypothetical protein HQL51_04140 [Magnetococcales bacterium]|nr:hypothetical protein [Magnetococcales bacterium]
MRVTQSMLFQGSVSGLQSKYQQLKRVQNETVSGNAINRPMDDPAGMFRQIIFSSDLKGVNSIVRNSDVANTRLRTGEEKIGLIHEYFLEAQDISIQLGNDYQADPVTLNSVSLKANALYKEVLTAANASLNGSPIFGGGRSAVPFDESTPSATTIERRATGTDIHAGFVSQSDLSVQANSLDSSHADYPGLPKSVRLVYQQASDDFVVSVNGTTDPASPVANAATLDLGWVKLDVAGAATFTDKDSYYFEVVPTYQGGSQDREIKVADDKTFPGNVAGDELIEGRNSRGVNLFGILTGLEGALKRGDTTEIAAMLRKIQDGRDQVADQQAVSGLRVAHVETVTLTMQGDADVISESMAKNTEVDIFDAITRMEQTTQSLQMMTITERNILNTSLIDFIR